MVLEEIAERLTAAGYRPVRYSTPYAHLIVAGERLTAGVFTAPHADADGERWVYLAGEAVAPARDLDAAVTDLRDRLGPPPGR